MDALSIQSLVENTFNQVNHSKLDKLNLNKAKDLTKTAQDFEAFFIAQMMEHMFAGISTEGMFGGGHAEKIYRSMMINEYGKNIAQNGGIGIADQVVRFMIETEQNQIDNNQGVSHE